MWKKEASRKQLNVEEIHDSVQPFNDAHTCVVLLTDASSGPLVNFTVINHGIDDLARNSSMKRSSRVCHTVHRILRVHRTTACHRPT